MKKTAKKQPARVYVATHVAQEFAKRICNLAAKNRRTKSNQIAIALEFAIPALERSDAVIMPRRLTAENGAKYAMIGEFSVETTTVDEDGNEVIQQVPISWDTIKRIYARAVDIFTDDAEDCE